MSVKKIIDGISAIYLSGRNLFFGTNFGYVGYYNVENPSQITDVFQHEDEMKVIKILSVPAIGQSSTNGILAYYETAILFEDGSVIVDSNGNVFSCNGFYDLLETRLALRAEDTSLCRFSLNANKVLDVYSLELFENSEMYDISGFHLVINQFMGNATIYTIDLHRSDLAKTFSFSGPILPIESDHKEDSISGSFGEINVMNMDDLDEEELRQNSTFNSLIDPSLPLCVHAPRTYIDFVKISPDGNIVASGGRDQKVVFSHFTSHDEIFSIDCKAVPRCGCFENNDTFYFGCDEGFLYMVNLKEKTYKHGRIGQEMLQAIKISSMDHSLVVLNSDNVLLSIDLEEFKIIKAEMIEENIIDYYPTASLVIIHTEEGNILYMSIDAS